MEYKLTLSYGERKAIDWIGYRYFHGDDLYKLLRQGKKTNPTMPSDEIEWSGNYDITFELPEHVAWEIKDGIEDENCELSCFADTLKEKLLTFIDGII